MPRVTHFEAVEYGFDIIGYLAMLIIIPAVIVFAGVASEDGLMMFFAVVGAFVYFAAGSMGIVYKVIADATAAGRSKTDGETPGEEPDNPWTGGHDDAPN